MDFKKREFSEKCPDCDKRTLISIIAYRKSFTPRSVKYFCTNMVKKANGVIEKCGFKTHIRLNHREYDWVGGVKPY